MSASIGLSAASANSGNSLFFKNTHNAAVPGRGNAFRLRHVGDTRHVGDGSVPRVYLDTSQLDWRVIIGRTSANQRVF